MVTKSFEIALLLNPNAHQMEYLDYILKTIGECHVIQQSGIQILERICQQK